MDIVHMIGGSLNKFSYKITVSFKGDNMYEAPSDTATLSIRDATYVSECFNNPYRRRNPWSRVPMIIGENYDAGGFRLPARQPSHIG